MKKLKIANFYEIYDEIMTKAVNSYNKLVDIVEDKEDGNMIITDLNHEDLDNLSLITDILQMIKVQISVDQNELNETRSANTYKAAFIDGIAWSKGVEMDDEYYNELWS